MPSALDRYRQRRDNRAPPVQARILAQILVVGGTVAVRAFGEAYQKALQNAAKGGPDKAARSAEKAARIIKGMSVAEAQSILGVA